MSRHFDNELRSVKDHMLEMAGLVERAIEHADEGLRKADRARFLMVYEVETEVNAAHKTVDDECVKLLALQQPLAADLRLIVAIIKINTDLERMSDQAVNIAHNAEHYIREMPLKPLVDLPKMFAETRTMVRESIDCFVRGDSELARKVLQRDDTVDALKSKIMRDVLDVLKGNAEAIEAGLALILIARNLERIGDHATNIAEDVIYAVSGEDIRHGNSLPKEASK